MYSAKIIGDSVNPCGNRLTTFELEYPRFVHAELMTHRVFSRNSASSRAIPITTLMERVEKDPAMPKWWGKNQKGMQAKEELQGQALEEAKRLWLESRDLMLKQAAKLNAIGLHKQVTNRILEPWMFITVIVTSTEYDNWFHLRAHEDAQPEIKWVAEEMLKLYQANTPAQLKAGEWHTPYVELSDSEHPLYVSSEETKGDSMFYVKIATARCARVSYLTHDGIRDLSKDMFLHNRLEKSGHWSPFEHSACALNTTERVGNFQGWRQYRKYFPNEHYGKPMP